MSPDTVPGNEADAERKRHELNESALGARAVHAAETEAAVLRDARIVRGTPDVDEAAAAIAVLARIAGETAGARRAVAQGVPSDWMRSQRPFRTPFRTDAGAWRTPLR